MSKTKRMGATLPTNFHREFIHRGPEMEVEGKTVQKRVGIVVGFIEKSGKDIILNIGWSLCNQQEGDRFNLEDGTNIAIGRATNMHPSSLMFKVKNPPTTTYLMQKGVAHSAIRSISNLIKDRLENVPEITHIRIYCKKVITPSMSKMMWTVE